MQVAAEHKPLDAAYGAYPDAGLLELSAERPYRVRMGRGHGDDHLAHTVALGQREGVLQRAEHGNAAQRGTELRRIVIQEPYELDTGRRAPHQFTPDGEAVLPGPRDDDRKSTRLNSSHSQISYAVFCLNK